SFQPDRAAAARARFDELIAEPAHPARRIRGNAATALNERIAAAISARDGAAPAALHAPDYEAIEYTTGATHDREGFLAMMRAMFRARDLRYRLLPLATLGDSLSLGNVTLVASGSSGRKFDVGPYDAEQIVLSEIDADHQQRRTELFASNHLGRAIVRLYERYAELLPAGPERGRAATTARSITALLDNDPMRWGAALSARVEYVDHRSTPCPPGRGSEAFLRAMRVVSETAEDWANRVDDVL